MCFNTYRGKNRFIFFIQMIWCTAQVLHLKSWQGNTINNVVIFRGTVILFFSKCNSVGLVFSENKSTSLHVSMHYTIYLLLHVLCVHKVGKDNLFNVLLQNNFNPTVLFFLTCINCFFYIIIISSVSNIILLIKRRNMFNTWNGRHFNEDLLLGLLAMFFKFGKHKYC